eukprot:IDg59t1
MKHCPSTASISLETQALMGTVAVNTSMLHGCVAGCGQLSNAAVTIHANWSSFQPEDAHCSSERSSAYFYERRLKRFPVLLDESKRCAQSSIRLLMWQSEELSIKTKFSIPSISRLRGNFLPDYWNASGIPNHAVIE